MIYDLSNPYDKEKFMDRVNDFVKGGSVVEMTRKSPLRSLAQNSYLHVLLSYFGSEFGYTLEEVKLDIFKRECNKDIFCRKIINKHGKTVTTVRSSASLTTAEMTLAIERFRNYSSAVCGLYLPEPDDHKHIIFAQQQIEKNKEFFNDVLLEEEET